MEDEIPMKRRKVDRLNDSAEGIGTRLAATLDVGSLAVKPDKFQKLRKITANCEKIQNTKNDDIIISSVGSSPSSSPDPEKLTSLSTPVDPAELKERLTALVNEEKEPGDAPDLQEVKDDQDNGGQQRNLEEKVLSPALHDVDVTANAPAEKDVEFDLKSEKFKELVKSLISERMRKLDECYSESVIPTLEKKIAHLESENKYLAGRAERLQLNLQNVMAEYRRHIQKPLQISVGIQVDQEPPPLTPVLTGTTVTQFVGKPTADAHTDSAPGLHKPPLTLNQMPQKVQPGHFVMQDTVNQAASLKQRLSSNDVRYAASATTASIGSMYTTSCCQPRLYSDATHKPGSHPNALATPRTYMSFVRPNGPVTATVYPQPQNHHMTISDLGVPRNSPPSSHNPEQSPPTGYVFVKQNPQGVVIRTSTRPQLVNNPPTHLQLVTNSPTRPQIVTNPQTHPQLVTNPQTKSLSYTGNPDRRGHVLPHQSPTLSPRITNGAQMPQPDHQVPAGRAQQQKSYQQPLPVNSIQMNNMQQHYISHPGAPSSPRTGMVQTAGNAGAPRQIITQHQMAPRAPVPYARPGGPPPLVRAQPQPEQQLKHIVQNSTPRFQGAVQTNSMPPRPHGPPNTRNMNPSMVQMQGGPGQGRVQSSSGGTIPVRLQGHPPPGVASNGPRVSTQPSPTLKSPATELPPPPPNVSISSVSNGIVLSWNMTIPEGCALIDSYQLFAYQNNGHLPHSPSLWKKLGIVKALPLPMACTLTQFVSGSVYHFAVRAIDIHGRAGNYSPPCAITLPAENGKSGTI